MDTTPARPASHPRRPRARQVLLAALTSAIALAVFAAPATGALPDKKKKAPVKLSGTVVNKGTTTARNGAVTLRTNNFYFTKTFVKTAPGTVSVTVQNRSNSQHTFTIDDLDIDEDLAPGKSITVDVDVDADPVAFYCKFHKGSGMQGALFVTAGAAVSSGSTTKNGSGSSPGGDPYSYG